MGLTFKKNDKLERKFEEMAIDPDGTLDKKEKTPAQIAAEKFIEKEIEASKKQAEQNK